MTKSSEHAGQTGQQTLFDLPDYGIAHVSGDDASDFLQGQLSNDINLLDDKNPHQLSAYCNPKGRVLALLNVLKLNQGYALIAPQAILNKALPRLKMFVMRAAVKIEQPETTVLLGMQTLSVLESDTLGHIQQLGAYAYRHYNDPQRFFVVTNQNAVATLKTQLQDTTISGDNGWRLININQYLPEVFAQTYEAFIPQTLNLDLVDGVNFKKGCYPGQEIIARVKYRGKPKTRMISVRVSGTTPIEIGSPIYIDGRSNSAGMVINTALGEASTLLSISLPVTHLDEGVVYLDEAKSIELERLPRAYEITV